MEGSPGKQDKKFSRRSFKSSRSATLPAGAVLTRESGEGFFSKIRRSFKIRKKGKFVLQHAHDDTEISGGAGLAGLSHSADSLQNADAENNGVRARFKSNKMPQESGEDDKNSVSVSSESGKCSPGDSGLLPSADENVCEGGARVSGDVDQSQSQGKQAGDGDAAASSDVFLEDEDNNNDKFIDDFDPDYETLDNIRRKLHDHHNNSDQNPLTDTAGKSLAEAEDSQGVQGNIIQEQDRYALLSDSSEPLNARESKNSASSVSPYGVSNSHSPVSVFEDNLYANAKILKQKQLRRSSELSTEEVRRGSKSVPNSALTADYKSRLQTDNTQCVCPPPLPARNYSEKEMATIGDRSPSSKDLNSSAVWNEMQGSAVTEPDLCHREQHQQWTPTTVTEDVNGRTKPSTRNSPEEDSKPFRRDSAFIESGPILTLNSEQRTPQGNNWYSDLSVAQLKNFPRSQGPQTFFTSVNSVHKSGTEKCCSDELKLQTTQEHTTLQQIENDLLFIDEDPVREQMNRSETMGSSSNAGYYSEIPNTVWRRNVVHASLGSNNKGDSRRVNHYSTLPVMSATTQEAQRVTMSCMSKSRNGQEHQDKTEPTYQELKNYSSSSGFPQSFENSFPQPRNSSASYHTSYTSPSAPTFPAAHSTTNGAPDLGEGVGRRAGRDTQVEVRPQGGHLRQRFLQSSGAARSWEEIPQPLPTPQEASGRKAVSEELPLKRTQKDLEHQSRKNRRHSSAVDTSRAHSDFMTSMKQLKECGWYWGPLSREEAVDKLRETCDGSFLVRDSANDNYLLAISFKHSDHIHHTRIEFHKGLFSFWEQPDEHSKAHICQFIEQTVEHSRKGNYIHFQRSPNSHANPLSIQLLYPVSRFYRVPSLQHVCRFLILCRVRRDLIHRLPLPEKIKGYLSEKQYYVEMLTED